MTNLKSIAHSPYTMPAAIKAVSSIVKDPKWGTYGDENWLTTLLSKVREIHSLGEISGLVGNATTKVEDHVAFLKEHGWDPQIKDSSRGELFVASSLKLDVAWMGSGSSYISNGNNESIHRVLLEEGAFTRDFQEKYPMVCIQTKSPNKIWISQLEKPIENETDLSMEIASKFLVARLNEDSFYKETHLDFPMVDLHVSNEVEKMIGVYTEDLIVSDAKEQLVLQMDENGAFVGAAGEIELSRGLDETKKVFINGPFIVLVTRDNLSLPLFTAYCNTDCWKKPAR